MILILFRIIIKKWILETVTDKLFFNFLNQMNEDYYHPFEDEEPYNKALTALDTDQSFAGMPDAQYFAMQDENHEHYSQRILLVLEVSKFQK